MTEVDLLSAPELKKRGWTEALIRKHLGEPDAFRRNPCYPRSAPTRLYRTDRVAAVEESRSRVAASRQRWDYLELEEGR